MHSEESEAAALRRCDWRFLLPTPPGGVFEHIVLLGAREGIAETIVKSGIARAVSEQVPGERCADALIVLRRSGASLERCAGCLQPGGVVYWEIDRGNLARTFTSVSSATETLRAAGLSPTGAYWVRPGFVNAQIYLPLQDEAVLRWYVRSLFTAATLGERVMEGVLRVMLSLGTRLTGALIPEFALTGVSETESAPPSVLGDAYVRNELWRTVRRPRGVGRLSDQELLLLTPGEDNWSRVVAMPFPRGGREPIAVLKLARVAERNLHTEKEQRVLSEIRSAVDADMRRTLPEGFGTFCWKELTVGMESYVSGRLLAATSARWGNSLPRKLQDLNLAADWLTEFHRQTQVRRPKWGEPELAAWSERALERYEEAFGVTPAERDLFERTRERLGQLLGSPFPIVWCHNGFSSWNICRENNDIGVFDWESAERGPALFDLIYLVFRWNLELGHSFRKDAHIRAFRELFLAAPARHTARLAVHGAIQRYMEALEIEPRSFPLSLVALWTIRAISRANRAQLVGQVGPDPRKHNVYVSYLAVLAADAPRLFRSW